MTFYINNLENNLKEKLSYKTKNFDNNILIKVNNTRKCNIKNKIGIITPQITDDFLMNSYISINKNKLKNENIENALTNENTTNKTSVNINTLNLNQFNQCYIKKINYDSSEIIIPCKPMINSIVSKNLMKQYSVTKRYNEDKHILFSSKSEIETIKINENNKNNIQKITPPKNKVEAEQEINELEELLKYQEDHLPIPLSKKNNEKYKILKMQKMKRISMPPNKSVRKFAEDIEPKYEKEFRINNSFSTMKKKKPVHSTRRIYFSNFNLFKSKGSSESFMIFRDKDIGIYEYWQAHIHETNNDEDIETDEDQKNVARNFSIGEVKEGIEYIKNNGLDSFINFNRYDYLIGKKNIKNIMKYIEENLGNIILSKNNKKK